MVRKKAQKNGHGIATATPVEKAKNGSNDSRVDDKLQHEERSDNGMREDMIAEVTVSATNVSIKKKSGSSIVGALLRSVFLDMPLATLFGLLLIIMVARVVNDKYLQPQLELMYWSYERQLNEVTYYPRICDLEDLTATDTDELVLGPNQTTDDAVQHVLKHGMSVYPNVIKEETADKLRDFILERNKVEEGFWVIENKGRFSFGIGANQDPIVAQALQEIATHPVLRPALEKIIGRNPALIEFTAITSMYGARNQFWHADVLPYGSAQKYARSFVPSYSLFIPLQDTTSAMGATHVCPGSHVCSEDPWYCQRGRHGFPVSGSKDLWPKTYGALVNQGAFHRGVAHQARNGPDRVLFILTFAPRPLFDGNHVQTRQISEGGSYSLRWDQWGHTLNDLENAPTAMAQPWAFLRSMGLYKPKDADWGWDFFSQASMRISNDDNGYHRDNLDDFLEKGGFKFLPSWLQATVSKTNEDESWTEFLVGTLELCESFTRTAYALGMALYFGFLLVMLIRASGRRGKVLVGTLRRLVIMHGILALLAGLAMYRIDQTPWARHIQSGKLWRAFDTVPDAPVVSSAPATLPLKYDVLIGSRYNSEYLGSYNQVLDVTHPGNKLLNDLVKSNSVGYNGLPSFMKELVSAGVVDGVKEKSARFLIQRDEFGGWSELTPEQAQKYTNRKLMMESNAILRKVKEQVEYLLSETKFGVLRRTALHRRFIPGLLLDLQQQFFQEHKKAKAQKKEAVKASFFPFFRLPPVPSKLRVSSDVGRSPPTLPPRVFGKEPYLGAWLKEGDIVDGKYNGEFNEWYRGTIVRTNAYEGIWDIEYDDGETDELHPAFVKPYTPLQLDEVVEMRDGQLDEEMMWYRAQIIGINDDGTYDLMADGGGLEKGVFVEDIRRFDTVLIPGTVIEARYQGQGDEWFRGKITRVRKDGTYDVEFDDGDREEEVEPSDIRPVIS